MDGYRPSSIEVAPLQADGSLYGFMLMGRWPNDTVEWARFLVLAVQMAAVPGCYRPALCSGYVRSCRRSRTLGRSAWWWPRGNCWVTIPFGQGISRRISRQADRAAPAFEHAFERSGVQGGIGMCFPAWAAAPRTRSSRRLGRGRCGRHGDAADQQGRH